MGREHYYILTNLIKSDLKERYNSSFLGFFWAFLNPLALMAVYTIIFTYILPVKIPHYPVFLMVGLIQWLFFSNCLRASCFSILSKFNLINKVYFPKELLPLASVGSHFIHFLLSLFALALMMVVFGVYPSWHMVYLPFVFLVMLVFVIALSLLLSAMTVFVRDTEALLM